jgi:predicted dehydrogenase
LTAIGVTPNYARVVFFGTEGWAEVRSASRFEFTPSKGEPTVIDFPAFDSLRGQLESFAAAAMGEAAFPVSPENAIAGVAAVEAMGQSVKSGGPIAL